MTIRGGRGQPHLCHSLLLRERWLTLLVGPVAANGAGTEPFAVHRAEGLLGFATVAECDKAVTAGASCLHIPHDACLGNAAEGGESLEKDFIVDFIGKVAHENVEVVGRVFL